MSTDGDNDIPAPEATAAAAPAPEPRIEETPIEETSAGDAAVKETAVAEAPAAEEAVPAAAAPVALAPTRAGFVALIGAPNAGKSTLLNQLVGAKVSIVSHKVQTTRAIMRGIAMRDRSQIIFVDTPGIFAPKRRLDRAMVDTAWGGAMDADIVALLIDARKGIDAEIGEILQRLRDIRRKKILILNKIDTVKRDSLLALAADANARVAFDDTYMVSALNGDGVEYLTDDLARSVPEGPWLYPEDQISDLPMRMLAAEITREKVFLRLHDELPYSSTVETDQWKEQPNGVRIEQTIFVERESQRKIVLGKGGATIKAISMAARGEISDIIEQPVHLFLFVKVRENWADDPERYREMGLEFPRG
ncbi:GTPase Era [Methylobrevis pamukkalensis]|uniref:GTPase Era n=1 Tax=Methylobrevis pamukkalensis TaxID=1439726 RepID=A0A1E3H2A2_9HYPH|nr:GTPase Era [Methylobrevis pamukkalensis]ODN70430.1 GTPase Era [Methylobrevis pamukkalensis]